MRPGSRGLGLSKLKMINAGWLIDGSGNPVRARVRLRVVNGCIQSIQDGCADLHGPTRPDGDIEILDLSNATVLPALVDSHVHLAMSGTMDQDKRLQQQNRQFRS